jgi:exonuclease SbcC
MNLTKIRLTNFLSHKDTTVDLGDSNILVVVGSNGAGKSALVVDSVTWALFGEARNSDRSGDQLISEGADFTEVEVEFTLAGDTYSIIRGRNRNDKSYVSVFKNGKDITCDTMAETQNNIERIIGATYETFSNSVCIGQGRLSSFSSLTPREAKRVLYDVLGLSDYEEYENEARSQMKILGGKLASCESRLESMIRDIGALDNAEYRLKILSNRLASLEGILNNYKVRKSYLEQILACSVSRDKESVARLETKKGFIEGKIKELEALRAAAQSKESEFCPLCGSEWSVVSRRVAVNHLDGLIEEHVCDLTETLNSISSLCHKEYNDLETKIREANDNIKRCERILGRIRERKGYLESVIDSKVKLKTQVDDLTSDKARIADDLVVYKFLTEAFGPNGIPSIIMARALDELQVTVNEILRRLLDDRFSVEFRLDRELKGGGRADTLQTFVYDGPNARPYHNFSGGERARIDLAIRLGIAIVLSRRNNRKIGTLLIDEANESLDDEGRDRFVRLLSYLAYEFCRILVVSHTDIRDRSLDVIEVNKVDGTSRVVRRV